MTAANIALLAPVPLVHLQSGVEMKGIVAFGSRAWEVFRKLDLERKGQDVDVYIYASHDPDGKCEASWHARYIRHVEIGGEDIRPYRPRSTATETNDSAIFWLVEDLKLLPKEERLPVTHLTGFGKKKAYKAFIPEGPLLIEHP